MHKLNRSQFIAPVPSTAMNTKENAQSTLECIDDTWGTNPNHYRYVNTRDENGKIIMRNDGSGKPKKALKLIGEPHCEWSDHYVKIRVNENNSKWYKHWNAAVSLFNFGKLPDSELSWFREEGIKRFKLGVIPLKTYRGSSTAAVSALVRVGVLISVNNSLILREDLEKFDRERALKAVVANEEVVV